jgi:hypothetical protein
LEPGQSISQPQQKGALGLVEFHLHITSCGAEPKSGTPHPDPFENEFAPIETIPVVSLRLFALVGFSPKKMSQLRTYHVAEILSSYLLNVQSNHLKGLFGLILNFFENTDNFVYINLNVHGASPLFEVLSWQPSFKGKASFLSSALNNLHNTSYTTDVDTLQFVETSPYGSSCSPRMIFRFVAC